MKLLRTISVKLFPLYTLSIVLTLEEFKEIGLVFIPGHRRERNTYAMSLN